MRSYINFDLTEFNSYKVQSKCSIAYFPESENDILELFCKQQPLNVIGNGNNIIFSQHFYDTPFVIFNGNFNALKISNNIIEAESGATMLELSEIALNNSLSGLEIFYDIPSSVGGAVVMNAGASGEEIKDLIIKIKYFDPGNNCFYEIEQKELGFEYRNSFFQKNPEFIITKAWLRLNPHEKAGIKEKMESVKTSRWAKQPRDLPNAGSVFKRPKGYYVGAIIEEIGLKGFQIGGAKISEKHGGFIQNAGNATGKDILNLIDYIRSIVKNKYNIDLEVEQRVI